MAQDSTLQAAESATPELLSAVGLASLMGITHQAVRNALYRRLDGKTIPPSFKLGRRRVWLRREVERWLTTQARQKQRTFRRGAVAMDIPRIIEGLELVDNDGDEVVVSKVNVKKRKVTLEGDDGAYDMSTRDLRKALLAGEFGVVARDGEVDGEDDEDEGDASEEGEAE